MAYTNNPRLPRVRMQAVLLELPSETNPQADAVIPVRRAAADAPAVPIKEADIEAVAARIEKPSPIAHSMSLLHVIVL